MNAIYTCRCMALDNQGDDVRLSYRWLRAQRATLRLTTKGMEWQNWSIPYDEIDDAMIYRYPDYLTGACTLVIWTKGRNYHFQLPSSSQFWYVLDPFWRGPVPFPIRCVLHNNMSFIRDNRSTLRKAVIFSCIVAAFFSLVIGMAMY